MIYVCVVYDGMYCGMFDVCKMYVVCMDVYVCGGCMCVL